MTSSPIRAPSKLDRLPELPAAPGWLSSLVTNDPIPARFRELHARATTAFEQNDWRGYQEALTSMNNPQYVVENKTIAALGFQDKIITAQAALIPQLPPPPKPVATEAQRPPLPPESAEASSKRRQEYSAIAKQAAAISAIKGNIREIEEEAPKRPKGPEANFPRAPSRWSRIVSTISGFFSSIWKKIKNIFGR